MSCDQATKAYCERAGAVVAPAFGGDAGSAAGALLQIQELAATRAAEERGGTPRCKRRSEARLEV